jgi:hypothetical protein
LLRRITEGPKRKGWVGFWCRQTDFPVYCDPYLLISCSIL